MVELRMDIWYNTFGYNLKHGTKKQIFPNNAALYLTMRFMEGTYADRKCIRQTDNQEQE